MPKSFRRLTACLSLAALAAIFGSLRAQADDHAAHPPADHAAATAHGAVPTATAGHGAADAAHPVAGDRGDVDYNKPPIPGFAPGLGTLFVFSLVLFGGFVLGARSLVWTPLIAALDQREARVNQAHADAEAAKVQAEQLLSQHEARMAQVHEQVQGLIAQTRKEAEQEKSRIIAEAEAQARSLRDRALAEIHQARDAALGQLHGSLDKQVARAVEQVVGHAV